MGGSTANPTRPIKQDSHAVCRAGRGGRGQKGRETSPLLHPSKLWEKEGFQKQDQNER